MNADDALSHVDPDLRGVLESLPDLAGLSDATLAAVRVALAGVPAVLGPAPSGLVASRVTIKRHGAPPLSALLYEPPATAATPRPGLLDLHGGGYVAGTAQREDAAMREACIALGCLVLVLDYRLAPECPYPAALDDAMAALDWLHAQAASLRIDASRIGVRGVSAGGGLAFALALRNRDENRPPLRFLQLLYPMLDDRTTEHAVCGQHVWTASANRYGWNALLRGQDREHPSPYAVPGRARDLSRLPPVFIGVGSIDLFIAENLILAQRLIDEGVAVELHVYPGAYHGFSLVTPARCAQALVRDGTAWLRRAMHEDAW